MKKITTLFLALAMVLSLCACGNSEGAETTGAAPEGLQVGYAKINITPSYEVGLGGYSDSESRASTGFVDYIYTTCIAVTSGEETILMYTVDNCATSLAVKKMIRQKASMETGIPEEKIFIGATHGHNCPSIATNYANGQRYQDDFYAWAVEAAQKALEDRAPATLLRAKADHAGMNFVRHYTLADGTFTDSSGASAAGAANLVGHPMPTDPQMVMLKFDREGDKKDILMVNWQGHPDSSSTIGYNLISPSWIGPMRNKLEKDTDMHVAYFTGASGNQVIDSKIPAEAHNMPWNEYGEALADCAFSMIESLEPVEGIAIKTTRTTMDVDVDHSWDHMLNQANEVYNLWKSAGRSAGDALAKTYNMSSSYQARAIRSRAAMGKTITMELSAFSIGGIGFTTGTYEMFSDNAIFVKDNSPFETTFVITGCSSYVPSDIAYTYRGYEADTGLYARGVGEQLADQYVKLLNEVK